LVKAAAESVEESCRCDAEGAGVSDGEMGTENGFWSLRVRENAVGDCWSDMGCRRAGHHSGKTPIGTG